MAVYYFLKGIWLLLKAGYYRWFAPRSVVNKEYLRQMEGGNPYIKAHLSKMSNDRSYQEYLQWLDAKGGDIPFEKWKTKEEIDFERKLNSTNRFKL